jgi:hypothetical protein
MEQSFSCRVDADTTTILYKKSLLFPASLVVASTPIALFIYAVHHTSNYAIAFMFEFLIKIIVCSLLAYLDKSSSDKAFTFQAEVSAQRYRRRQRINQQ